MRRGDIKLAAALGAFDGAFLGSAGALKAAIDTAGRLGGREWWGVFLSTWVGWECWYLVVCVPCGALVGVVFWFV